MRTTSFGVLFSTQHCTTGSTFGGCTPGVSGATGPLGTIREQPLSTGTGTGTSIFTGNPTFGEPQQREPATGTGTGISSSTGAFGQPMPAKDVGGRLGKPGRFMITTVLLSIRLMYFISGPTIDPSKLEGVEELLRKSLLGEELVNTQFLLFSARSPSSSRVMKPRVLCANNTLLAKSSKYFLDRE